ncbi:MAG: long-chain fatty acid--CoA ligase, partial [Acaryochloridaceae cyanobacterium RL_2_7]|nr:long-chain fatty acid--CoA ligase [Acaryochloridaceae cyanobacterium RL_2_7]
MTSSAASVTLVNDQYKKLDALCDIWAIAAQAFGDNLALIDPHGEVEAQLTYRELQQALESFAAGLQALAVKPGDRIALFS